MFEFYIHKHSASTIDATYENTFLCNNETKVSRHRKS